MHVQMTYIHIYIYVEGTFMSYFGLLAASTKFSHHGTSCVLFAAFCLRQTNAPARNLQKPRARRKTD